MSLGMSFGVGIILLCIFGIIEMDKILITTSFLKTLFPIGLFSLSIFFLFIIKYALTTSYRTFLFF